MAVTLKYIAQSAMDAYYRDYKGNTGFFDLNDFIFRAGASVAEYYQKTYDQKYAELRQEKRHRDELIGVDTDLLSVQELTVKDGEATLKFPVMSFLYDTSGMGYQQLISIKPKEAVLERSSMDELWQYNYLPKTCRIFWRPQNGKLKFYMNANANVSLVELYYIPSVMNSQGEVFEDAMIADGIMDYAINATIAKLRQVEAQVVKESNDFNENKIMQTEMNKVQLK